MKPLLSWCFKNITQKFPGTLILLALALAGVSIGVLSQLSYNPRMDNLLPENLELVREFNEVVDKTGGSGPLVIVLENLEPSRAEEVITELGERLSGLPGVHFVDFRLPKAFLNNRQLFLATRQDLLELETLVNESIDYVRSQLGGFSLDEDELFDPKKLRDLAEKYDVFEDVSPYYKGKKERNYYIFLQPKSTVTDTDLTTRLVEAVENEIAVSGLLQRIPGLKVHLTGSLIVRLEENATIMRDLKRSAALAAFLASFIIIVYTRSRFSIPLIIFPLLLSLTYTFALTKLLIGHVNIISGFLVAILMGLGIDYGIHLYIRFKQELLKGKAHPDAVEIVMTQVGRSSIIAMFTTISVFSILAFSEFRGFSEFGLIAMIGIVCAFLTYFFIFPAQVLFYDRIHWLRKPQPRIFHLRISNLYSNTPYFLSALFLLAMAGCVLLLPRMEFEYDFQKLRGHSPAADYETQTTEDFGFAFSPTVILTPDRENLFHIHQALERVKRRFGKDSTLGMHHSLGLFGQKEYLSKKDVLDRLKNTIEEEGDIIQLSLGLPRFQRLRQLIDREPFDETAIPESLVKRFTAGGEYLLLVYSPADKNFFDVRNIYRLEEEISATKKILAAKNINASFLNENLLAAEILDWVKTRGPVTLGLAMAMVFLILVVDLWSIRLAIKTFLPLITGLAMTGAAMTVFQVKLNFINFVMLPSIVGIMIDHCIYLAHHILDYPEGKTIQSVQETGSAILLSALTTLGGYASLNIASHEGIRSIASLMELGIITCTACAIFMLPALFDLRLHRPGLIRRNRE